MVNGTISFKYDECLNQKTNDDKLVVEISDKGLKEVEFA